MRPSYILFHLQLFWARVGRALSERWASVWRALGERWAHFQQAYKARLSVRASFNSRLLAHCTIDLVFFEKKFEFLKDFVFEFFEKWPRKIQKIRKKKT
jgi:hypothetical protein